MKMIEAFELTKIFGPFTALDHLNFEVSKGEVYGLLGPNGAGKTTTIRLMTAQTRPTSGHVEIAGYDVEHNPVEAKKHVGLVPEVSNIYDEMSAWDNLIFSAKLFGVTRVERASRARRLLELIGLFDRRRDKVGTFSRGMKRRVTIAAALIHEPELLILDEPTTGLDVQSALTMRRFVKELNHEGTTVFMTTHYIEEADQLCQRVAIINRGKIVTVDTPENLKSSMIGQQVLEVSFSPSENVEEKLVCLASVNRVSKGGDKYRLYVEDASQVLPLVIDCARENDLKIVSLNTLRLSLEDAFVKIAGISTDTMALEKEAKKKADVG